jgi:hypothetical protein
MSEQDKFTFFLLYLYQHHRSRVKKKFEKEKIILILFQAVLSNQANLDDLNLNLESFQGGLDCNVEEVRVVKEQSFFQLIIEC